MTSPSTPPKTTKLNKDEALISPAPLLEAILAHNLENVAIFQGAGVDPDGLASQATMAAILEAKGAKVSCFYRGTFNRPQNRTMSQELNFTPKSENQFKANDKWTCIISVDGPAGVCPIVPDFIIDHHQQDKPANIGSDIRLIGATSSIMWEYAVKAGIDFTSEIGARLATALAIGIVTDTKFGSVDSVSDLDYEALSACLKHKDNNLYKKIINYQKPQYYHDLYAKAWAAKQVQGTILVAGLGNIPEARGGVISDLADKFVETEGINTAVVCAMVDGDIDISVRSTSASISVDDFVKNAFGGGGGKKGAGRAYISIPLFKNIPENLQEEAYQSMYKIITHKALQIANDNN